MSFTAEIKNELARLKPTKKCCQIAELSAILRMDGSFHIQGSNLYALHTATESAAVARKTFKFLTDLFSLNPEVIVRRKLKLKKSNEYVIYIPPQAGLIQVFNETGILDDQMRIRYDILPRLVRRSCCAVAYLRGAFLGGGTVIDSQKGAHFELTTDNQVLSENLQKLLRRFQLKAKIRAHRKHFAAYLKESEQIIQFLALVGAFNSLLRWEDVKILRGLRNQVNRLVNCDTANLKKAVGAAQSQLSDIHLIKEVRGLGYLPKSLREIAEVRLENPEVSIKELGELTEPSLSKSAVYHRLRRLSQLANQFRGQRAEDR